MPVVLLRERRRGLKRNAAPLRGRGHVSKVSACLVSTNSPLTKLQGPQWRVKWFGNKPRLALPLSPSRSLSCTNTVGRACTHTYRGAGDRGRNDVLSNKTADFISGLLEVFPHWSGHAQAHRRLLCVWLFGIDPANQCVHVLISHPVFMDLNRALTLISSFRQDRLAGKSFCMGYRMLAVHECVRVNVSYASHHTLRGCLHHTYTHLPKCAHMSLFPA